MEQLKKLICEKKSDFGLFAHCVTDDGVYIVYFTRGLSGKLPLFAYCKTSGKTFKVCDKDNKELMVSADDLESFENNIVKYISATEKDHIFIRAFQACLDDVNLQDPKEFLSNETVRSLLGQYGKTIKWDKQNHFIISDGVVIKKAGQNE